MRLLIDAGNTRIKWGLTRAGDAPECDWLSSGARVHAETGALHEDWRTALQTLNAGDALESVWLANVAGDAVKQRIVRAMQALAPGAPLHCVEAEAWRAGVRNGYRTPQQLGCDRWLTAIGARAAFPDHALLLVCAGTATTIDVLREDGLFVGGLILPGLSLMLSSLGRQTAQLPSLACETSTPLNSAFADNTDDAIRNGCASAQCGAILLAWRQLQAQLSDHAPRACLLSGGARHALAGLLDGVPHRLYDNLVLTGLQVLARGA